jgi:acyl carrier protein
VQWGPHWDCLEKIATGENCGIAYLSLATACYPERTTTKLHAGLLDIATSFLVAKQMSDAAYLPSSYEGVTIYADLPNVITCYAECLTQENNINTLSYKIWITDKHHNLIVRIEKFTLAKVGFDQVNTFIQEDVIRDLTYFKGHTAMRKPGIKPEEGIETFRRLLNNNHLQVITSVTPLVAKAPEEQSQRQRKEGARLHEQVSILEELHRVWCEVLGYKEINKEDNFFDIGGTSIIAVDLQIAIKQALNINLDVVEIFSYPSISKLAKHLLGEEKAPVKEIDLANHHDDEIAVIGYSGLFPGSETVDKFWENIAAGKECLLHLENTSANDEYIGSSRFCRHG